MSGISLFSIYAKFWISALFLLPSTLLHELSHYIVAFLIGGRPHGFTVLPRRVTGLRWHETIRCWLTPLKLKNKRCYEANHIFGSVSFSPRIKVLNFLAGMAPLSLLFGIYVVMTHIGVLREDGDGGFSFYPGVMFHAEMIWWWILIVVLLMGSKPSRTDVRVSIDGFFSISGLILITLVFVGHLYWDEASAIIMKMYSEIYGILI